MHRELDEVRTCPINLIRRVGKRLVCIPQQRSCIGKVAVLILNFFWKKKVRKKKKKSLLTKPKQKIFLKK